MNLRILASSWSHSLLLWFYHTSILMAVVIVITPLALLLVLTDPKYPRRK